VHIRPGNKAKAGIRGALLETYCAPRLGSPWTFVTGGGFHLPMSTSDFGAYMRIVRLNGPFGAGSQLASKSVPGLSFWK
jgi:hypothetical protein